MRRPSLSALALPATALLAGSGFAALRYANGAISAAAFLITCAILALATVGALCRPRGRRAGWIGFALFGWGYMALAFGPWDSDTLLHLLPTSRALEALRHRLKVPEAKRAPAPHLGSFGSYGMMQLPVDPPPRIQPQPDNAASPRIVLAQMISGPLRYAVRPGEPGFMGYPMPAPRVRYEDSFALFGQCLWALLAACVGGVAAHVLSSTSREATVPDRDSRSSSPADDRRGRRRGLSVLKLMGVVVAVALGLAALRNASVMLAGVLFLIACGVLGLAVLGALCRPADRRAGWLGFALFGWGYMALAFTPLLEYETAFGLSRRPALATAELLEALFVKVPSLRGAGAHIYDAELRTLAVQAALEKPVPIPFKEETPLSDVVKYIHRATVSPDLPDGIPIYVDPAGLQEQDKTMESTVSLDVKGVPLRTSLALMLRQLDLDYRVKEGLLYILSRSDDQFTAAEYGPFQRIGHSLFALLAGCLGAFAGPLVAGRRTEGGS